MLGNTILEAVSKELEDRELPDEKLLELVDAAIQESEQTLLEITKQNAPEMLQMERQAQVAFEQQNYERWQEPLDLLRTLWVCCKEIGEVHSHEGPCGGDELVFDTLAHIHPRALLIVSEILCLLEGGFADGALTRWRSLHELAVTAMFIKKHGREMATSYRLSHWFSNSRAAKQYNKYSARSGLAPLSEQDLEAIETVREKARIQLGRTLKTDWDWASEVVGKPKPTFSDIEKDVEMDHWRPRYRWACGHIHAGFERPEKLLGMSESESLAFQVGPSNSGLVDPLQMAALSLTQMTTTFLLCGEPDLDRVIYSRMLLAMATEIGPIAQETKIQTFGEAHS